MVDSHAHLDFPQFDGDREETVRRALETGVAAIIDVGCDLASSYAAVSLAERYSQVYAAVGYHPHHAAALGEGEMAELSRLADHPKVVALGEMGLDFYRDYTPRDIQIRSFQAQLELARRLGRPVIIHSRQADDATYDLLAPWAEKATTGRPLGVMHCYSGDLALARRYLALGFSISLAGPVTYPNAARQATLAQELPLTALLVETDAPFLPPQSHRGRRNEPAYLVETVARIATLKEIESAAVAEATAANAARLFGIPV